MTHEKKCICSRSNRNIVITENKINAPTASIVTRYCYDVECSFRSDCEYGIRDTRYNNIDYIVPTLI